MFFNNMIVSNCLVYHANAQKALDKNRTTHTKNEQCTAQDMEENINAIIEDAKNSPLVTVQYP